MAVPVLHTQRLRLRPLGLADAPDIVAGINDFEVTQWLAVVPFPYALADAEWFINHVTTGTERAWVLDDGALRGIISIGKDDGADLGYWLARSHWGRGYMTEAGQAVIAHHLADPLAQDLTSGYFLGNARSAHVLTKLGFEPTFRSVTHCKSRDSDMPNQRMGLSRSRGQSLSNPR